MEARAVARGEYEWHGRVPDAAQYESALDELVGGIAHSDLRSALEGLRRDRPGARHLPRSQPPSTESRDVATGKAFASALATLAEREDRIVALGADLEKPCHLAEFARRFPERYLEMGIAEQDMVSCAGGLALAGRLPVVNTYAAFLRRALEQIAVNASERTRVLYAGHYAGLCYTTDGATHTSTGDVAAMRSVPGMIVLHPALSAELPQILKWFVTSVAGRPVYLRLHRTPAPRIPGLPPQPFRIGHGFHARQAGGRLAVVTSGPHLTAFCCQAADSLLAEDDLPVDVVTLTTLRPVDPTYARALAARYERLAVVEEAFEAGGLLDELAHAFAREVAGSPAVRPPEMLHLAADDFAFSTREPRGLYERFGLDPEGIRRFLRRAAARR